MRSPYKHTVPSRIFLRCIFAYTAFLLCHPNVRWSNTVATEAGTM